MLLFTISRVELEVFKEHFFWFFTSNHYHYIWNVLTKKMSPNMIGFCPETKKLLHFFSIFQFSTYQKQDGRHSDNSDWLHISPVFLTNQITWFSWLSYKSSIEPIKLLGSHIGPVFLILALILLRIGPDFHFGPDYWPSSVCIDGGMNACIKPIFW